MPWEAIVCPNCGTKGMLSEYQENRYRCLECNTIIRYAPPQQPIVIVETTGGGKLATRELHLVPCPACSVPNPVERTFRCVICGKDGFCENHVHFFRKQVPLCEDCENNTASQVRNAAMYMARARLLGLLAAGLLLLAGCIGLLAPQSVLTPLGLILFAVCVACSIYWGIRSAVRRRVSQRAEEVLRRSYRR